MNETLRATDRIDGTGARPRRRVARDGVALLTLLIVALGGCREGRDGGSSEPAAPEQRPGWDVSGDRTIVGVADEEMRRALNEARRQAQRTLDDARQRWSASPAEERGHWAIKWAAPVQRDGGADGSLPPATVDLEHVWVIPVTWTRWRIEGVLASSPLRTIGYDRGDLVGFSVDEVADWVHTMDGPVDRALNGRREGGFTVDVLERAFGQPTR